MTKKSWLLILSITGVVLTVRLVLAWLGYFPFSWDFARDMLWARQLTIEHKPMLVGAWGSLDGTYFGAAYYYLLAIPLLLSKGDPRSAVMMVSLIITALIPMAYLFGIRFFHARLAWWWAGLFALMPVYTNLALYSFPQQLIPVIFLGYIMVLWTCRYRSSWSLWFLAGFLASLFFHFEPVDTPIAYFMLVGWVGYLVKHHYRFPKFFVIAMMSGLSLPLIPNVLYDIRHHWGQIRAFLRLAQGIDVSLIGGMPFWERLIDRPLNIGSMISVSLTPWRLPWIGLGILILCAVILKVSWKKVITIWEHSPSEKTLVHLLAFFRDVSFLDR